VTFQSQRISSRTWPLARANSETLSHACTHPFLQSVRRTSASKTAWPEITPHRSASIRQPHWHRHLDVKRPTHLCAGIGSWPAAVEAAGMSRHAKRKSSKPKRPKTKLGLPDLDHSKSAVLDSRGCWRLKTASCWRRARFSSIRLRRVRNPRSTAPSQSRNRSNMATKL